MLAEMREIFEATGQTMIHSQRMERKNKAIAEVLAMIADAPLNSRHNIRVRWLSQTKGCGRTPPNFAPPWTVMPGAQCNLSESITDGFSSLIRPR